MSAFGVNAIEAAEAVMDGTPVTDPKVKEGLTKLASKEVLNNNQWEKYGRLIDFIAQIVYNVMIATQIWTGLVLANIIEKIFNKHNDMLIFSGFSIGLIFFLAVLRTITTPIKNLR